MPRTKISWLREATFMLTSSIIPRLFKIWLWPCKQNKTIQEFCTKEDWLTIRINSSKKQLKICTQPWIIILLKHTLQIFTTIWEFPMPIWICSTKLYLHCLRRSSSVTMNHVIFMRGQSVISSQAKIKRLWKIIVNSWKCNLKIVMLISEGLLLTRLSRDTRKQQRILKKQSNSILSTQNFSSTPRKFMKWST